MSRLSQSWTHFHDAVSLTGEPRLLQVDLCHLQYNSQSFTSVGGIVNTHPGSALYHSETIPCSFGSITASEVLCPRDISSACTIYTLSARRVKNGVGNNSGFRVESITSWNVPKSFLMCRFWKCYRTDLFDLVAGLRSREIMSSPCAKRWTAYKKNETFANFVCHTLSRLCGGFKKFHPPRSHLIEWQIGSIMQKEAPGIRVGDIEPANFLFSHRRMACKSGLIGRVPVYQSHLLDFLCSRMCDVWRFPSRSRFSGGTTRCPTHFC